MNRFAAGAQLLTSILAAAGLFSGQASAAEYSLAPRFILSSSYDDNARLSVNNEVELVGYAAESKFRTMRRTDRLDVTLDTDFKFNQFDDRDFDTSDQDIGLRLDYRFSDKSRFNLFSRLDRDSVRTSEADLDDEPNITADRRELLLAGLGWKYRLNERHEIDLSYSWQKLRYASDDLNDYQNQRFTALWSMFYSSVNRLQFQINASRFEPEFDRFSVQDPRFVVSRREVFDEPMITRQQDTLGAQIGFVQVLNEKWQLDALAGYSQVESQAESELLTFPQVFFVPPVTTDTVVFPESRSSSLLLNTTLSYTGERLEASFNAFSRNQPSSDGRLNENYGVSLQANYDWTERLEFVGRLRVSEVKSAGGGIDDKRTLGTLDLRANYRLAERWRLGVRYRYRFRDRDSVGGDAQANGWFLRLAYTPGKVVW